MTQRTTASTVQLRSPISELRTAFTTGLTAAALLAATLGAHAQDAAPVSPAAAKTSGQSAAPDTAVQPAAPASAAIRTKPDIAVTNQKPTKSRKTDKTVASKDTKQEDKRTKKDFALQGKDSKLPDKQLYDKAEDAIKHGRYDVGRLDLQTLLNTYQESQYMMPAKLAIADSWYREGGTAALTQAEQEYRDFITFFPNAPEAAEAQMRVGDIYFKQMDKPDRDYTTTVHAEREYRLMLQQFPDSPLVPQAQNRLRQVQEVLAARETSIASFYATRTPPDLPAAIARFQTVADTYPLYSRMDDVLIGLGDAYEAEAKFVRAMKSPAGAGQAQREQLESGRARLERIYDEQAAAAYRKVVIEHAAAPHVEDAKDRLVGMGLPIPTPTPEQIAASTALESSRGQYTLSTRVIGLFLHQADTVPAATIGAPPLDDPKPTNAATVVRKSQADFMTSMTSAANQPAAATPNGNAAAAVDPAASAAVATPPAAAPLSFQDVPTATGAASSAASVTSVPQASPSTTSGGGLGIEIVQPGSGSQTPLTAPATPPAFPGTAAPAPAVDPTGGIKPVGPPDTNQLAPIEKPAAAPEPINDAATTKQPTAQAPLANGKKPKVECDKSDESCSRHKKKKGLAKLNPF
jgi:outer membrane protein assembly factor BamD